MRHVFANGGATMDKLPPDAQRLLDAARDAVDPLPAERARADAALRSALAAHGVADLPPLDAPPAAQTAASGSASAAGTGLKLGLAAVAVTTLTMLAIQVLPQPDAPPRPPAPARADRPQVWAPAPLGPAEVASEPQQAEPSAELERDPAPTRLPPRASSRTQAVADDALQGEVRLIAEANGHLQGRRFEQALRVLEEHARRYPEGALRAERAALRVLSLCADGPSPQALRERERFLRAAPRSLLAARVRDACTVAGPEGP
jgi:hypothetical protein